MSEVPSELKFLSSHEWVLVEDGVATIGVSDHAQELLGDLVYVELPDALLLFPLLGLTGGPPFPVPPSV
jgi:glycine cleavage system H lipoate-binding protein